MRSLVVCSSMIAKAFTRSFSACLLRSIVDVLEEMRL